MTGTAMGPLKPEELDPIVRVAALKSGKKWIDSDENDPQFCTYGSDDGQVIFGQVTKVRTKKGEGWDAIDLHHTNAAQTGARCIGHFQGLKAAKAAVELYWQVIE